MNDEQKAQEAQDQSGADLSAQGVTMTHPTREHPTFVTVDGELWHLYSVPFKHDGAEWAFMIYARNNAEAAQMVASISTTIGQPERVVQINKMASYN